MLRYLIVGQWIFSTCTLFNSKLTLFAMGAYSFIMQRVNAIFKKESKVAAAEVRLTLSIPKYGKCSLWPTKQKGKQNLISDPLEEGGTTLLYSDLHS